MCLGVPMKLTAVSGREGKAELDGVSRQVALDLVPQAREGDYVLIHAGYAIQLLDEQSAKETLALIAEIGGVETDS
ncbi:MAG: HypC/HybG/HupF family hydrogenase formation chaperone [Deltaproteobacteria bacterium]|nr:HypC/HybG/HupF family hydrogenase formation chaperone [Deltaproteobacteria bacterium]